MRVAEVIDFFKFLPKSITTANIYHLYEDFFKNELSFTSSNKFSHKIPKTLSQALETTIFEFLVEN